MMLSGLYPKVTFKRLFRLVIGYECAPGSYIGKGGESKRKDKNRGPELFSILTMLRRY